MDTIRVTSLFVTHGHPLSKLGEIRRSRGITQQQAADVLGVDRSYISHVEKDDRPLRVDQFAALALLYELTDLQIAELVHHYGPGPDPHGDDDAPHQAAA